MFGQSLEDVKVNKLEVFIKQQIIKQVLRRAAGDRSGRKYSEKYDLRAKI